MCFGCSRFLLSSSCDCVAASPPSVLLPFVSLVAVSALLVAPPRVLFSRCFLLSLSPFFRFPLCCLGLSLSSFSILVLFASRDRLSCGLVPYCLWDLCLLSAPRLVPVLLSRVLSCSRACFVVRSRVSVSVFGFPFGYLVFSFRFRDLFPLPVPIHTVPFVRVVLGLFSSLCCLALFVRSFVRSFVSVVGPFVSVRSGRSFVRVGRSVTYGGQRLQSQTPMVRYAVRYKRV